MSSVALSRKASQEVNKTHLSFRQVLMHLLEEEDLITRDEYDFILDNCGKLRDEFRKHFTDLETGKAKVITGRATVAPREEAIRVGRDIVTRWKVDDKGKACPDSAQKKKQQVEDEVKEMEKLALSQTRILSDKRDRIFDLEEENEELKDTLDALRRLNKEHEETIAELNSRVEELEIRNDALREKVANQPSSSKKKE